MTDSQDDFNPRSPYGERLSFSGICTSLHLFQSTLPLRGATPGRRGKLVQIPISIHAPLTGSDLSDAISCIVTEISIHAPLTGSDVLSVAVAAFQGISIHAPLTGSDRKEKGPFFFPQDFNPRSPYGERRGIPPGFQHRRDISIHAPLTGSDFMSTNAAVKVIIFQSTLPLRGATGQIIIIRRRPNQFQSTLPLRGATAGKFTLHRGGVDFNPRSPYGERRFFCHPFSLPLIISIHAPLTGSDLSLLTRVWYDR